MSNRSQDSARVDLSTDKIAVKISADLYGKSISTSRSMELNFTPVPIFSQNDEVHPLGGGTILIETVLSEIKVISQQ
jgi:hypothetical protein